MEISVLHHSLLTFCRTLKHRSNQEYSQLPAVITYDPGDFLRLDVPSPTLYSRLLTRLEYLQNLFLLQRLFVKYTLASVQELVDISAEMLEMASNIWKHRDRLSGLHSDFEWMVTIEYTTLHATF